MIDILLSTFNGELYLGELIESLLTQTQKDWRLLVRDDGSSDSTLKIINDYTIRFPAKIIVLEGNGERLGACHSFAALLSHSSADYSMFCDQDDVWFPEKVEKSLRKMQDMESEQKDQAILVHTDMTVVDQKLAKISDSFWKYQHLDPGLVRLNRLLTFNNVTGATILMNRRLRDIANPVPNSAIMHDWWLALVASAFGKIGACSVPTVLYRQHGANELGADRYSPKYFAARIQNLDRSRDLLKKVVEQTAEFMAIYKDKLSDEQLGLLDSFSNILKKGRLERLYILIKFKIFGSGSLRNLGMTILILLMKRIRAWEQA